MAIASGLSVAQRVRAASAYRTILRSARFTFASDRPTRSKFVDQTKNLFLNSVLPSSDGKFDTEVDGVLEVAQYLRRNVVQGQHSEDGKRLVLRMTKETELGDNDSIKNPKPLGPDSLSVGCCSAPTPKLSAAATERREQRRRRRESQTSA